MTELQPPHRAKTLPHETLQAERGLSLPKLLLLYQTLPTKAMETSSVVFIEKSRRIGITWGVASDAVLNAAANKAAGGMDVFYIGFNLDMTREFIDVCASWAKAFKHAATSVEEFMFPDDNEKEILAYRVKFDSGFEIVALTSRPRSLRGRQGYVIIDEAAFHDDLKELMKAALALLIWGGKVLVISTHNGTDNPFNQYITDIRAGRLKYGIIRIDFDDALRDGLYKRICLVKGDEWTQAAEDKWREGIIDDYGDGADEELFCIPRMGTGAYLSSVLVESRMIDRPILRFACDDQFKFKPEDERYEIVDKWCHENLLPLLNVLDFNLQYGFGEDFARSADLTNLFPMAIEKSLHRTVPFGVELRNVPFRQQLQIIWFILDRLPNLIGAAFDARGNGQQVAEETRDRYGSIIHEIMPTPGFYQDIMPKYRAALEDATISIPRDADILSDHRIARETGGKPHIPAVRTTGQDGKKRHGDSLVALMMAYYSTRQDYIEYGYESMNKTPRRSMLEHPADDDDKASTRAQDFGAHNGAW